MKMLTKNMKMKQQMELIIGCIAMTNLNCMLYQNNYVKTMNKIKKDVLRWEKLQLSLLGRISVIK